MTKPLSDHFEPLFLHSDDGMWLLADSEEHARTWLAEYEPDYKVIEDVGWMHDVGWNRDEYETKAEFDREAGLNSWWEGCRAPRDGQATEKCRRAFEVGCVA